MTPESVLPGLIVAVLLLATGSVAIRSALPPGRIRGADAPHGAATATVEAATLPSPVSLDERREDPDALDLLELGLPDGETPGALRRAWSGLRLVVTLAFLGTAVGASLFLLGRSVVLLIQRLAESPAAG